MSQIFAANHPHRLRTLRLTNYDAHTNWLSPQILPSIEVARQGTLLDRYASLIDNRKQRLPRWDSS